MVEAAEPLLEKLVGQFVAQAAHFSLEKLASPSLWIRQLALCINALQRLAFSQREGSDGLHNIE